MKTSFLRRPKRALCIILILCSAAFYIIYVWGKDNSKNSGAVNESFAITQRYYGIDAAEMERIAAIPLEDALSGIRGLRRIFSSSENGRTKVFCHFEGKEQGRYEAVREAAQRVYESLPSAAQRPEISSSGDSRVPVWTAALNAGKTKSENIGAMLEKTVKPALEGLPGAASVEISGAGVREIVITLKSEEAAARKITAADIAYFLAQNDVLLPGGIVRYGGANDFADLEIPVMIDGRFDSGNVLNEFRRTLIPVKNSGGNASFVRLEDLAFITEQERDYENRSRLDGKETALIAVMGSEDADLGKLSTRIKDELRKFPELEFTVLSDRGKAEREARSSALGAALEGACMVALLCALLRFGKRSFSLICSLTVPAAFFFSAALLILLGFSLDKLVLAGLSAGVGAAVDTAILSAEYFRSCHTIKEGRSALQALRFPLVSGALTTVIALLPLMIQKTSGMNSVAWAVASVNMVSMVLALTLLPPLFLWNRPEMTAADLKCDRFKSVLISSIRQPILRFYRRKLAFLVRLILRRPLPVICCWLLLSVLGITALCLNGADVEQESSEDSVYAQIEFEGGLHIEETDRLLAIYGIEIKNQEGIRSVQTVAKTGTGSALVSFDPKLTNNKAVRGLMRNVPLTGAFVYIVESSGNEKSWRIRIAGDEDQRCRELASEAARRCSGITLVSETVLNFKEGSPRINLIPDRERIALNALSFGGIGQTIRRGIHGPVAYKRIDSGEETDVRIKGGSDPLSREEVLQILIKGETSPFKLERLAAIENSREAGSIQREDRQRSASISIRTKAMDPRRVKDRVMASLSDMELPPGYSVEFDPEALKAAETVDSQIFAFILALLFCYMLIAALKESFNFPLALLAVVPPSLSVPALAIILCGYPVNAVSAAAFVAVAGLAINAAALTADALENAGAGAASCYGIYRRRLPVLAATTLTTVAAALPFLFIKSNAAMPVKTLSLVSALGVAVSALCAITLIPALKKLFPGILK
jgi:multidrug efflux pump subunit AcrB